MKFTRSTYPDIPQVKGSPCWNLVGRRFWFDADWHTRFPFGTSMCLKIGRESYKSRNGFTLDVNPPLGEPNRLYLWLGGWHVTLGLPSLRTTKPTGETYRGAPVYGHCLTWPHLDGPDRYRYHKGSDGKWVRNDTPEPLHWGWLTIERGSRHEQAEGRCAPDD